MGIIETNLYHGPVFFNVYPNLSVSLTDRNINDALTLRVQTQGYNFLPGTEIVAVIYRVYFKVMNSIAPNINQLSLSGKTVLMESNLLTSNIATPRQITWEEIRFPESWSIPNVVPPQPMINYDLDQVAQFHNGNVIVNFQRPIISKQILTRSQSSRQPYKVSFPGTSSRHSFSQARTEDNESFVSARPQSVNPSTAPPIEEITIEGIQISDQQIPHGIYVRENNSPTNSEFLNG